MPVYRAVFEGERVLPPLVVSAEGIQVTRGSTIGPGRPYSFLSVVFTAVRNSKLVAEWWKILMPRRTFSRTLSTSSERSGKRDDVASPWCCEYVCLNIYIILEELVQQICRLLLTSTAAFDFFAGTASVIKLSAPFEYGRSAASGQSAAGGRSGTGGRRY